MLFRKVDKDRDRYYLLAGMGKRLALKKRRLFMAWSLAIGIIAAGLLAVIIYLLNGDLIGRR